MKAELDALIRNNTWTLVHLPPGMSLLVASGYIRSNVF